MLPGRRYDPGPYLGQYLHNGRIRGSAHYRGPKHLMTIGPPGSSKTVGLVVPNLATLRRSGVVIDTKCQIAPITYKARARMGKVLMLYPHNLFVDEMPHLRDQGFDPIPRNPASPRFPDECFALADTIIRDDNEKHRYFTEGAKNLLTVGIMWERLRNGPKASLANVRHLITAPTIRDEEGQPRSGFQRTLIEMAACDYRPIANLAGRFVERLSDKHALSTSLQDVIETLVGETRWLDSPPIAASLSGGKDFDFGRLREEIWTVFICLPIRELATHATYLRVVIGAALNALYEPPKLSAASQLNPVMFLLDEFAALGRLTAIETALGVARDSRIQLWPFLQDLSQLIDLYPHRYETFLTGVGALTAYGPKDWRTAEFLAKLGGQKTEIVESESHSESANGGSISRSLTPQGFPLFRPEELRQMPPRQMLCFVEPEPYPFFTVTPPYSELPFCRGLDPNPYYDPRQQKRRM